MNHEIITFFKEFRYKMQQVTTFRVVIIAPQNAPRCP